ncbi:MAG: hypothetical protein ACOH12_04120 [Parvibaculaceae bacterium]
MLIAVSTAVNFVVRLVPSVVTMAEMATAMPAAIRPYSMAVAPLWLAAKDFKKLTILEPSKLVGRCAPIDV